ncbi:GNAT family N-acetyltransferase [Hymenobacter taeanensis]|uniref:GNAT family N-acetyltransferase n=1 Tax=Hymenobacter taeanensis TaxID=2735321 RepID=A0A6M6BKN2_9BACT|nr:MULTISPECIES: GNAT family protein [Hymenobacter]QJX49231.1 GNAT family N-acetyltransferase [Hymenobacter taeanensis]UOQ83152.1 GNAT family N-acetyltransferase [Hymenobacter sp. 5414T-23]
MNIFGKHVLIRAIEEHDLPALHKWANDPDIWNMLAGWHFPSNFEYQKKWFDNLMNNQSSQRFAIDVPGLGLIGTANIVDIDWKNRRGYHGIMLGDNDVRGKGYGFDTIMTIMRYAFEELYFERLDTDIIEYNKASINIYTQKCGWKIEGVRRRWYFRRNRFWDNMLVGITREDYFTLVEQNKYWA